MKNDSINLKYVTKERTYSGTINREEFYSKMEELKIKNPDNNEISTKLCVLIPDMYSMTINQVVNDTQDVPHISFKFEQDGDISMLRIGRNHTKIWNNLRDYCKKIM